MPLRAGYALCVEAECPSELGRLCCEAECTKLHLFVRVQEVRESLQGQPTPVHKAPRGCGQLFSTLLELTAPLWVSEREREKVSSVAS